MYKYYLLLIVLVLHTNLSIESNDKDESKPIFSTYDKVVIIDQGEKQFSNLITYNLMKDGTWAVLFYNRWCGHCIRFAPVFIRFANDVFEWQRYVHVAVVDCVDDLNTQLCQNQSINAFPTLKFINQFSSAEPSGSVATVDLLRSETATFIQAFTIYRRYKALSPVTNLDKALSKHLKYSFLIITNDNQDTVGMQVQLDMSRQTDVLVNHMDQSMAAHVGVNTQPIGLVRLHSNGSRDVLAENLLSVREVVAEILGRVPRHRVITQTPSPSDVIHMSSYGRNHRPRSVNLIDLESSLAYIISKEVPMTTVISGQKLAALKKFINVLYKYFPARQHIREFLHAVVQWLRNVQSRLTGQRWKQKIQDIRTKVARLDDIDWVYCAGSLSRYRGYPCSLWMLFHSLTVSAYNSSNTQGSDPHEVLDAVVGYIQHFFGCSECRDNFLQMARGVKREVRSHRQLVLWLWRAHNAVNKRLRGDVTEDPNHLKVQFPGRDYCAGCASEWVTDYGVPKWEISKVFQFLMEYYDRYNMESSETISYPYGGRVAVPPLALDWLGAVRYKKNYQYTQAQLAEMEKSKLQFYGAANRLNRSGSDSVRIVQTVGINFSSFDLGLCFLLWIASSLIVLAVYFKLLHRRQSEVCPFV